MERFVLIDGNAIIHRAFHALPLLTTSKGVTINAVFGFTSMLLKVFSDLHPKYVICTFDLKEPTFRHKEYKEYKATRPKMADELIPQIDLVHQVAESINIPIFAVPGFEADDVIGTLAKQIRDLNKEIEIIIVTGDRDTLQLVNQTTKVYAPVKGLSNPVFYDEKLVFQKYGLKPVQLIDYKTLVGDPTDNIPGLSGIGPKTATTLLQKFQTIEGIYKNLDQIENQTLKEKLEKGRKDLELSKRLVTIILDVPIKLDLEKAKLMDYNRDRVVSLFREFEFNSLIPRLPMDIHEFKIKGKPASVPTKSGLRRGEENKDQLGLF